MSTSRLIDEENDVEYTEEYSEGVSGRCYRLQKIEYERCRQEIHNLKRKLELDEAMLREAQETNETLERSLDRRISEKEKVIFETEEKYRVIIKEYDNVVSSLETKLAEQTTEIQKLREHVNRCEETERVRDTDQCANISLKIENTSLQNRIDELVVLLQEEKKRSKHAEGTIEELQIRCDELEHTSRNMKEQLDERSTALEDARAQLILRRVEAASLETDPAHELCKGNSLFAEVEDRRQKVVDKMNALHKKYDQAKRTCKAQMAEIKILRAKRVEALRQWEIDTYDLFTENDELIHRYKHRISDLESKLKSEIKKNNDTKQQNCVDTTSFVYFQSLLDAKTRETNELRVQIEYLYTRMLIQEEAKTNITKQLQHWQYKASCLEAQMCAPQAELKLHLTDNAEREVPLKDFKNFSPHQKNEVAARETEAISKQLDVSQTFDRSPLLDIASETEDSFRPSKNVGECKAIDQLSSKEKPNHDDTVDSEGIPLNEPCEFKHARNSDRGKDKYPKKMVHFQDKSITEKSNDTQKSTKARKYPVVYIPVDSND